MFGRAAEKTHLLLRHFNLDFFFNYPNDHLFNQYYIRILFCLNHFCNVVFLFPFLFYYFFFLYLSLCLPFISAGPTSPMIPISSVTINLARSRCSTRSKSYFCENRKRRPANVSAQTLIRFKKGNKKATHQSQTFTDAAAV